MMTKDQSRPVLISGTRFDSMAQAFRVAVGKGYKGSRTAFVRYLQRHEGYAIAWGDVLHVRPRTITPNLAGHYARRAVKTSRAREEMARLCAELDARKAAMKAVA